MMIFFSGVSPHFSSLLVIRGQRGRNLSQYSSGSIYMGVFLLSYNSRSSEVFVGSSCKLKSDGGLILLLCFSACYFLIYVNVPMLNYISHHISSCISNSSFDMLNACMKYKIQGEISMILLYNVQLLFKANSSHKHIFRGSSSISCNQIPQYQYLHFICLSPLKT